MNKNKEDIIKLINTIKKEFDIEDNVDTHISDIVYLPLLNFEYIGFTFLYQIEIYDEKISRVYKKSNDIWITAYRNEEPYISSDEIYIIKIEMEELLLNSDKLINIIKELASEENIQYFKDNWGKFNQSDKIMFEPIKITLEEKSYKIMKNK